MNYKLVKPTKLKDVTVNEEVMEIPECWEVIKLSDVFDEYAVKGRSDLPLLMASQAEGVIVRPKDEKRVNNMKTALDKFKVVYKNSFVIGLRAFKGGIEYSEVDGVISPAYTTLKSKTEINYFYFKKLLKHFNFIQSLQKFKIGIRDGQNLPFKDLKTLEIIAPGIEEQNKINFIIQKQEKLIKNIKKLIHKKETLLNQLSNKLLSGKVRIKKEFNNIFFYENPENNWLEMELNGEMKRFPKDWEFGDLKTFANVKGGISAPKNFVSFEDGNVVPFFRVSNLSSREKYLNQKNTKEFLSKDGYRTIPKNSILIAKSGESIKQKYRSILSVDSVVVGHIAALIPKKDVDFLYYEINYAAPEDVLLKNSTMPSLSTVELENFQIYFPKEDEQKEIVNVLKEQENSIEKIKKLLTHEEKRLEWLLDNLLFGKCLVEKI